MRDALALLEQLTARLPPLGGTRHHLVMIMGPDGRPTLMLGIRFADETWRGFTLDQEDLGKPVAQLVDELAALVEHERRASPVTTGSA